MVKIEKLISDEGHFEADEVTISGTGNKICADIVCILEGLTDAIGNDDLKKGLKTAIQLWLIFGDRVVTNVEEASNEE